MIRVFQGALLIALGGFSVLAWQYANKGGKATTVELAPSVTLSDSAFQWAEGIGYTEPKSELRHLAFKASGVIAWCGPKAGDRVRCGEIIAQLDDAAAKAAVESARQKVNHAKCKLVELKAGEHPHLLLLCGRSLDRLREQARHLRTEAHRQEKTKAKGASSENERNEAATKALQAEIAVQEKEAELLYLKEKVRAEQIAVADAEVREAEAAVVEAELRLADTRLAAPFDGVVLKYIKREGEGVSPLMPPEPVVLYGDISRLRVRAEIDERQAKLMAVGQMAEVYGRNVGGDVYTGRIVETEQVMGGKTLFARSAQERKDLHVLQIVIEMSEGFRAPVGLQVDVRVRIE